MREKIFTCPFTGCKFSATIDKDKNMIFKNPLTGTIEFIHYDPFMGTYEVPRALFHFTETLTLSEAANVLDVSRQRMTQIAQNEVIPPKTVNGQTVFLTSDVLQYDKTRKPGAPRKDVEPCKA